MYAVVCKMLDYITRTLLKKKHFKINNNFYFFSFTLLKVDIVFIIKKVNYCLELNSYFLHFKKVMMFE